MIRIPDIISRTRRGERLSRAELEKLILGYARGEVPDYQVAAWLMAVCFRGMDPDQVAELTDVMVSSGQRLDLTHLGTVADKHSTGGVGDKTSLVVVPLVAACGVPVAKMSGRGLGFTGGTLDKLESIPGLTVDRSVEQLIRQVQDVGLAIVSQSPELVPADQKLYALRDVTATVDSIPLIASSVMSKKLAAGAHAIVLDVKTGRGAFMQRLDEARELARLMVHIGRAAGRRVSAFITDMSQPLGRAIGNSLEVIEAIETLRGRGPSDLVHLAVTLAGELLALSGAAPNAQAGRERAERALAEGAGLAAFTRLVQAQGGDPRYVDDPGQLPRAVIQRQITAELEGLVVRIDARLVAEAALLLGAGRERKDQPIDHAVGIELAVKVGERVTAGQPLATIHANAAARCAAAEPLVRRALQVAEAPAPIAPLIHARIGP